MRVCCGVERACKAIFRMRLSRGVEKTFGEAENAIRLYMKLPFAWCIFQSNIIPIPSLVSHDNLKIAFNST